MAPNKRKAAVEAEGPKKAKSESAEEEVVDEVAVKVRFSSSNGPGRFSHMVWAAMCVGLTTCRICHCFC